MKRRKVTALVLTAGMILGLAACGSSEESTSVANSEDADSENSSEETESVTGEDHTIAIVLKTLNSEYWSVVSAGIEQAEEDFGCTVELNGPPSETSYDEQMNMIETLLAAEDTEAIVIAPLQPETTATLVEDADIPVLAVDTTFESDSLLSYIGVSNYDAAYAMGEYAAQSLGEGSNFVILAGTQGDTTSEDRIEGYTDGVEDNGCTVLDLQYTDAATDKATTSMEGLIQQYGDEIDGVLSHSDDVAMGAANVVEQSGMTEDISVYGFGGISGAEPVQEGTLVATVNINPYDMGYTCVEMALAAIEGEEIDEFYPTETEIIDSSNVDDFLVELEQWTGE